MIVLNVVLSGSVLTAAPDSGVAEFLAKISEVVNGRWSIRYDADLRLVRLTSYAAVEPSRLEGGLAGTPFSGAVLSTMKLRLVPQESVSDWASKKKKIEDNVTRLLDRVNSELPRPTYQFDTRAYAPISEEHWMLFVEYENSELAMRLYPNYYWGNFGIVVSEDQIVVPVDPHDGAAEAIRKDVDRIKAILKKYE